MIVTHSCNQPVIQLPNSALSGVNLISGGDYKGYSMYEARIDASQTVPLRSPDDEASVHFYYVITGSGRCERKDGKGGYEVGPDHVVALSSDVTYTLKVSADGTMRVLVVYYPDVGLAYKSLEQIKSLSDLEGTERDISFGNGNSRRFTLKKDGFPLTITNTHVAPTESPVKQEYRNHIEAAYYIHGSMTYHWPDGKGGSTHEQTKVDKMNGTNYFMDFHDKHEMVTKQDSFCICVFNPALTGNEIHNYKDGYSCY